MKIKKWLSENNASLSHFSIDAHKRATFSVPSCEAGSFCLASPQPLSKRRGAKKKEFYSSEVQVLILALHR
jgi:hypothetical protein